jgi:hypothetical protein
VYRRRAGWLTFSTGCIAAAFSLSSIFAPVAQAAPVVPGSHLFECTSDVTAQRPYREGNLILADGQYRNCTRRYAKTCLAIWSFIATPGPRGGWYQIGANCYEPALGAGGLPAVPMTTKTSWSLPGMFQGRLTGYDAASKPLDTAYSQIFVD